MTTPYRSSVPEGRDGFGQLVLGEWTKLRSVPRWVLTLVAAIVLTILVALLSAAASGASTSGDGPGDGGGGGGTKPTSMDAGHLLYRQLTGDGSLTARVATQEDNHDWAKAGLMIRESAKRGSRYAAIMVTPDHGVRLRSNGDYDAAGSQGAAPRWLRLTRTGTSVTGYESADGTSWKRVGAVELSGLPRAAEAALFTAAPETIKLKRQFGSESVDGSPTMAKATFDKVRLESVQPQPTAPWRDIEDSDGGSSQAAGTFTLTGSGDMGPYEDKYGTDATQDTLASVLIGLMAIVALAVLFVTAEYKRGMVRTTFIASPRRGQVLAAKAVVIGAVTFVAGLVACFGAFLISQPLQRSNNIDPASLSDGAVLRAVVGSAALLAVVAVFSLALAMIMRHSAAAITAVLLLLLVPQIIATGMPVSAAMWLERVTPSAGFAIQQTVSRYDTAIGPMGGFGVLCGYTVVALALAAWRLLRRDA